MNKRINGKFVGFSKEELNYGIPELDKNALVKLNHDIPELDENMIFEMREALNKAKDKLRQAFRNEIARLDVFIKQEYSVIPSEDNFIKWFEENKLYKNWEDLPKISDEEIFNLAQTYLEECKKKQLNI